MRSTSGTVTKFYAEDEQPGELFSRSAEWHNDIRLRFNADSQNVTAQPSKIGSYEYTDYDLVAGEYIDQELPGVVRCIVRKGDAFQTSVPDVEIISGRPQEFGYVLPTFETSTGSDQFFVEKALAAAKRLPFTIEWNGPDYLGFKPAFKKLDRVTGNEKSVRNSSSDGTVLRTIEWYIGAEPKSRDLLHGYEQFGIGNWDGDGAEAISVETLQYARTLVAQLPNNLGRPEVSPGLDGSVALEWIPEGHNTLHKLFFDIGPGPRWKAYWKLKTGEFGRLPGETLEAKEILQRLFDDLS